MDVLQVPWVSGITSSEDGLRILERAKRSALVVQKGDQAVLIPAAQVVSSARVGKMLGETKGEVLPIVGAGPFPGLRGQREDRATRSLTQLLAKDRVRGSYHEHLAKTALGRNHRTLSSRSQLQDAVDAVLSRYPIALLGVGPGSAVLLTDREVTAGPYSRAPGRYACTYKIVHLYLAMPSNRRCGVDNTPVVRR